MGHSIEDCDRDPNLKTNSDAQADQLRLNTVKECRKLHADSLVSTTHFIKKAVMVPHNDDFEDNVNIKEEHTLHRPFTRGIMTFDDYNYSTVNDYVLVVEPEQSTGQPEV